MKALLIFDKFFPSEVTLNFFFFLMISDEKMTCDYNSIKTEAFIYRMA